MFETIMITFKLTRRWQQIHARMLRFTKHCKDMLQKRLMTSFCSGFIGYI